MSSSDTIIVYSKTFVYQLYQCCNELAKLPLPSWTLKIAESVILFEGLF